MMRFVYFIRKCHRRIIIIVIVGMTLVLFCYFLIASYCTCSPGARNSTGARNTEIRSKGPDPNSGGSI